RPVELPDRPDAGGRRRRGAEVPLPAGLIFLPARGASWAALASFFRRLPEAVRSGVSYAVGFASTPARAGRSAAADEAPGGRSRTLPMRLVSPRCRAPGDRSRSPRVAGDVHERMAHEQGGSQGEERGDDGDGHRRPGDPCEQVCAATFSAACRGVACPGDGGGSPLALLNEHPLVLLGTCHGRAL